LDNRNSQNDAVDLLNTWPASLDRRRVMRVFTHGWQGREFYFTLGRSKPRLQAARLFWTHQGRIIGSFTIDRIVQNDGSLPKLRSLTGEVSEWQIKRDSWVAICHGPLVRINGRVFHEGFRGWRYFNLGAYRQTPESKVRL
jgi:hypothetical protein